MAKPTTMEPSTNQYGTNIPIFLVDRITMPHVQFTILQPNTPLL